MVPVYVRGVTFHVTTIGLETYSVNSQARGQFFPYLPQASSKHFTIFRGHDALNGSAKDFDVMFLKYACPPHLNSCN